MYRLAFLFFPVTMRHKENEYACARTLATMCKVFPFFFFFFFSRRVPSSWPDVSRLLFTFIFSNDHSRLLRGLTRVKLAPLASHEGFFSARTLGSRLVERPRGGSFRVGKLLGNFYCRYLWTCVHLRGDLKVQKCSPTRENTKFFDI